MAIFKKNKKEETKKVSTQEDNELKDEISKAYDEIMSGNKEEKAEEQPQQAPKDDIAFENEVFKSKVKAFKQERNQQNLIAVLKMLSGRKFLLPSVCNVEDPFEKLENGNVRLKEGTVFNPAFLTSSDKKVFLPIFTDEESMVQKSPSGVLLKLNFEQCVTVVYDEKNPVEAVVINPFTENMIIGIDLLKMVFKEKKKDEFVGGLPFYGKVLLGNKLWAGVALSLMYIIYAMCCLPAQGFNVVSSIGQMAEIVTGASMGSASYFYYIVSVLLILVTAYIAFGGIRKVTRVTDGLVPVMAVIYVGVVFLLILLNLGSVPYFFGAVFGGAFTPQAVFGGIFGTVLVQGVKRGLMSNEAGQGTITMAAGAANTDHPCEQGCVQSIGVFLDTMVICTLTGFVVVMAHVWTGSSAEAWFAMDRLPKFLESAKVLTPGTAMNAAVAFLLTFCFCLFAFTCLVGMISFSEIAANRISSSKKVIYTVRIVGIFITAFGIACSLAGIELGNLWAISDLGNILIVFANIPLLYLGAKCVFRATAHFKKKDGTPFTSSVIGRSCPYWDERAGKATDKKTDSAR